MEPIRMFNRDMELLSVIDYDYKLLWTERYDETGDFRLDIPGSEHHRKKVSLGNIVMIPSSERGMIMEDITYTTDKKEKRIIITGNSLEDLMSRRVTTDGGYRLVDEFEDAILTMIGEHMITPTDTDRIMPNFFTEISVDDISDIDINEQFEEDTIYSIVRQACISKKLGFKVRVDESRQFVFSITQGVDRSREQTDNPHVVFSEEFANILDGSYYVSDDGTKNAVLVVTDAGVPSIQDRLFVYTNTPTVGLDRREMILVATDIQGTAFDPPISDADMLELILQRGKNILSEKRTVRLYDGNADINKMYIYNEDFFIGDVVQYVLGMDTVPTRVVEVIRSIEPSGPKTYVSLDFEL